MADYNEIKALLLDDRSFRRALLRQLQQDLKNGTLVQDPEDAVMIVKRPHGTITYREASQMIGCSEAYVRMAVSRCHVVGGEGVVDKNSFVEYVMTLGKRSFRVALTSWLEREEMNKHQLAVVA